MFDLSIRVIVIASLARIIFVPLFLLSSYQAPPNALFNSDWYKVIDMLLFAFTNGYLSTLCCVKAPHTVYHDEEKGQVGGLIGITISTGIMLGSLIAIPVGLAIENCPGVSDQSLYQ